MKVKIYLGDVVEVTTDGTASSLWRYKLEFYDNPADSTSFFFDTRKNGETYTTIMKTFTTVISDDTYSLIGGSTDITINNLLLNLQTFNTDPNITYYLSPSVNGFGFYDIYIDVVGLDTDIFTISIGGNSTSALNLYAPTFIEYLTTSITDTYETFNKIDLYDDENIELTSKLSDIEKLSNVFADLTNTFTVPANPHNNKLFKHYYDVDIDNTFNANIRVNGYIEIDTFPLRFGKIQLEAIKQINQMPDSYKITFYGGTIQLTDLFGDDTIDLLDYDLDIVNGKEVYTEVRDKLAQFDFEYNSTNFINSINLPTFKDGNVITPLIAYADRDWNYGTADAIDISTNSGAILDSELFQALRVARIIEAIEAKYQINFSRHFFGGATFNNLFMWLNASKDIPLAAEQVIDLNDALTDSGSWSGPNVVIDDFIQMNTTDNYLTIYVPKIGTTVRDFKDVEYWVRPLIENQNNTNCKFRVTARNYETGEIIAQSEVRDGNDTTFSPSLKIVLKQRLVDYTVKIQFNIELQSSLTFDCRIFINMFITPSSSGPAYSDRVRKTDPNTQSLIANRKISLLIPKMKVIEFLQGIMKMFKLIVRPITENAFYINTLNGYYSEGNVLDVTDYIDMKEVNIERPEIYKTITFKYQKTNNVLGKRFRETYDPVNDEIGYGDLKSTYRAIESKNDLKVELPFENMLFERLSVQSPSVQAGEITDWVIGQSVSLGEGSAISKNNSKPILFFNNGIVSNVDYPLRVKWGNASSILCLYSYLIGNTNDEILDQVTDTINFNAEVDPWHNQVVANSLYLNYWENWINTIYDIKQRKFNFKGNLPPRYVEEISLNDRIIINNNRYKINDYKLNLTTGDVELNLFNDIFEWSPYSIGDGSSVPTISRTGITANAGWKYYDINILKNKSWSIAKVDTGDDVDWVTITTETSGFGATEIVILIEEKASQVPPAVYLSRTMNLVITIDEVDYTVVIVQNGLET